ncbi:polysaccharide biosynthesis protein [Lachnospiraceae bacterium OttesenSCG-928-D06]|nr:polysaccharide biosynthesis protein [Lachnospiraceae bacterium OttesenSCG-928-D06]
MANNNKGNRFVLQAGILASAGLISRIIGLLYRKPLTSIILAEGIGYYNAAYNFYTIILLIASYSIPSAISKVIAQKLAVREYKNAHRIFKCALIYVVVVGGTAGLILFFLASVLVSGPAIRVLKIFAPTVFFSGLVGVLRGYFQAHKSMLQTSVSQIFEQIINAFVSVGVALLLIYMGTGTLEMPEAAEDITTRAMYGAMGSAIGTGFSVFMALLFMYGLYLLNKKMILRRVRNDRNQYVDSYGTILRMIIAVVTPFILSTAVYNLGTTVNQSIYIRLIQSVKEVQESVAYANFGVFNGQAVLISNIPIAFASAMASAMIPQMAQFMSKGDLWSVGEKISVAIKSTMLIAIPSAVGLFVLARPITRLLFAQANTIDMATVSLKALSASVIFYSLSTLSNSILQGIGKANIPIINAAISLVIQSAVCAVLIIYTDLDIYSLAVAMTVFSLVMCILNQMAIRRVVGYRQEIGKTFIIPLIAAGLMGAATWAVYEGVYMISSSVVISVVPAMLVAVCVYFAMLIVMKGVTESELRGFPKGYLLVKMAKKIRLL